MKPVLDFSKKIKIKIKPVLDFFFYFIKPVLDREEELWGDPFFQLYY